MSAISLSSSGPEMRPGPVPTAAVIVDAGVGNLGNLRRALAVLGADARISRDPAEVAASRCLLLPGVGAFRAAREAIRGALEEALREALTRGAWLLGICVGYQLLFESGEEFGDTDGLALVPGRVTRLPDTRVSLPHIGWNRLCLEQPDHPLLTGIADGAFVYFVHSYAAEGVPADWVLATALHGRPFPAAIARGRLAGTQFHPEKSQETGLRLIANFLVWAP